MADNVCGSVARIECSHLISNCACYGGGMYLNSSCATIYGGGMYLNSSCATICNSCFDCNYACYGGGGMYLYPCSCAVICNSCFDSNCAAAYGGGMYPSSCSCATICNSCFDSNCACYGGMVTETYTYRPRSAKEYVIKATACNSNGKGSACTILEVK